MSDPWGFAGSPDSLDRDALTLLEGTTFCISAGDGDVRDRRAQGLFVRDTRVLSTWTVEVDQRQLTWLVTRTRSPFEAVMAASASLPSEGEGRLLLVRQRLVGNGMRESLTIFNAGPDAVQVSVSLRASADFADVFAVKDGRAVSSAEHPLEPDAYGGLTWTTGPEGHAVRVTPQGGASAEASRGLLRWVVPIEPHGRWSVDVEVAVGFSGDWLELHHPAGTLVEHAVPVRHRQTWRRSVARLETSDRDLSETVRRGIDDLATLRIYDPDHPDRPIVAAGAPWFMALFGRDSLLSSLMLLPVDDELALGTLRTLAAHQGRRRHPTSEEQPGRILHELRFGPDGTMVLGGGTSYYGSVDATPLFVMLLGEVLRWSGVEQVTSDLVRAADRALDWMITDGDPDGDAFIEYHRATETGLVNQGWKDSWDGVNFADGTLAAAPIALAEVQGYAYAAFRARAAIGEALGDAATSRYWSDRATSLKAAFDAAFWLPERGWFAAGLDRDKRPIDALTSANGHLLWTGIVDDSRAEQVVAHLMGASMFSGWGVRTLATTMGAYDPLSYHNGSVWPHDTAICAGGMARYGFGEEAAALAVGVIDMAGHFDHRLPELVGGFARTDVDVPVPYPTACSPQAWAAAAPIELLRAVLSLEPALTGLRCSPTVPERFLPLRLLGARCRGTRYDVSLGPQVPTTITRQVGHR